MQVINTGIIATESEAKREAIHGCQLRGSVMDCRGGCAASQ